MANADFKAGDKVVVTPTANSRFNNAQWWPHGEVVTAKVLTVYKNGTVKVVLDFLAHQGSTQGRKGTNISPDQAVFTEA